MMRTAALLAAAVALLQFSGCASRDPARPTRANSGKIYAVTAARTPFYRFGPQQDTPPDDQLPKDTLVTLIRPAFGYAQVQLLSNNVTGYVASSDIRPAPETLLAALNPPAEEPGPGSGRADFDIGSSEPPPPEILPDPDLPPASEEPGPQ